jgi:hypothetical protein
LARFGEQTLSPSDDRRAGDLAHNPVKIGVDLAASDQAEERRLPAPERLARLPSPQVAVLERQ